jgi:hypothetical protein
MSCRYLKLHGAAQALSSAHAAAAWTKPRLQRKILSRRWRGAEQETGSLRDRRLGIRVVSIGRCWLLVGLHNGLPTTCSIPAPFLSPLKQVLVLFPILYSIFCLCGLLCTRNCSENQDPELPPSVRRESGNAPTPKTSFGRTHVHPQPKPSLGFRVPGLGFRQSPQP